MKISTIIGARPQFIKAAAVSRQMKSYPELTETIIHTGQHFDKNMSDIFFEEMQIPKPDYHLAVAGGKHGASTGQMLEKIENVLLATKPDAVLVYGDTNSTLAGALAAKKLLIPLIHVEAGLRSFNMKMPEEINRILTDRISDLLCCPTNEAIKNLEQEGFDKFNCKIERTGDVMFDAAMFYRENSKPSRQTEKFTKETPKYVLATIHRAENTDNLENLKNIIGALNDIHQKIPIILPIHPRTRNIIKNESLSVEFNLIDPVGYFDMIHLIENADLIMTDSGGLQKEAFFFEKNCVTLREQTEWTELIDNNVNILVGSDPHKIIAGFETMRGKASDFKIDLYGNGNASIKIIEFIKQNL